MPKASNATTAGLTTPTYPGKRRIEPPRRPKLPVPLARLLLIVPLAVVAVVAIVFAVRELEESSEVTEGSQPGPTPSTARTVVIRIENDRFRPEQVSLSAGQTVRWVNADDHVHTVSSAPGSPFRFRSGRIAPGEVYEETFEDIGVFRYRGDVRPRMKGKVTVLSD